MYEIAHCLLFVIISFFFLIPLSVEMLKHKSMKMIVSLVQCCAKAMRTNFALCSLQNIADLFRSIFRSARATIKRNFGDNSPSQAKVRKANRKIASSNFRTSEISKKIDIKSNETSANFPTAINTAKRKQSFQSCLL